MFTAATIVVDDVNILVVVVVVAVDAGAILSTSISLEMVGGSTIVDCNGGSTTDMTGDSDCDSVIVVVVVVVVDDDTASVGGGADAIGGGVNGSSNSRRKAAAVRKLPAIDGDDVVEEEALVFLDEPLLLALALVEDATVTLPSLMSSILFGEIDLPPFFLIVGEDAAADDDMVEDVCSLIPFFGAPKPMFLPALIAYSDTKLFIVCDEDKDT